MKTITCSVLLLLTLASNALAQTAPDAVELTKLLNDLRTAPAPKPSDPKTVYTAEDIRVQQYGDTAVVAFRLVATTDTGGSKAVANLLNSGTFVKRNGKWQVVNWQSTRMPRTEAESKSEVTTAEAALQQAILAGAADKLSALTDPSFIWTRGAVPLSREQLIAELRGGKLKYEKPNAAKVSISIYGDTAVVRGELQSATQYTVTFINQLGVWRAVSMHTSG